MFKAGRTNAGVAASSSTRVYTKNHPDKNIRSCTTVVTREVKSLWDLPPSYLAALLFTDVVLGKGGNVMMWKAPKKMLAAKLIH